MKLELVIPGLAEMTESIMAFQQEDTTPFWSESLYRFYPRLDREYAMCLSFPEREGYLREKLARIYEEERDNLEEKRRSYAAHWQRCCPQIEEALSEAFDVNCKELLNDMVCHISLNPISPRFLREHSFEVFWLNSERGFVGTAIHEIIHLVWFHVWHQVFGDDWEEYEAPSLKWILSEMVVEPIMSDPRLAQINPYYPRENGGCIYPYFFDMYAEGEPVLDTLTRMYRSQDIRSFMKNSYAYCQKQEQQIRTHIAKAENRT